MGFHVEFSIVLRSFLATVRNSRVTAVVRRREQRYVMLLRYGTVQYGTVRHCQISKISKGTIRRVGECFPSFARETCDVNMFPGILRQFSASLCTALGKIVSQQILLVSYYMFNLVVPLPF